MKAGKNRETSTNAQEVFGGISQYFGARAFPGFAWACLLLLLPGCASQQQSTEQLLTWSGFKTVPAATPARKQLLASLPPDQISKVNRNGTNYYVFPDRSRKLFYVGKQTAYESYKDLRQDVQAMADTRSEGAVDASAEMISVLDWVD